MSPIAQQRFIGSILLLCMLSGFAFFLIDSANDGGIDQAVITEGVAEPSFVSSVAAIDESGDIEVIEYDTETLLDPHKLTEPEQVRAPVKDVVHIDPISDTLPVQIISDQMWSLQLASFTIKAGADALRKQVQTLGYEAKIEKAETAKGDIFRVRIGPTQDKLMLEAAAKKLQQTLTLQPQMLKQIP